jgi:hypothetical protein
MKFHMTVNFDIKNKTLSTYISDSIISKIKTPNNTIYKIKLI